MKKIEIWLVEYFNDNNNAWEWGNVIRQSESTEEQARKETYANNFGCIYNQDTETFKGDSDDIEHITENWKDNTRAWSLSI